MMTVVLWLFALLQRRKRRRVRDLSSEQRCMYLSLDVPPRSELLHSLENGGSGEI